MSTRSSPAEAFVAIELRSGDAELAERVVAEALAVGATGTEEREQPEGVHFIVYAPAARSEAVERALRADGVSLAAPAPVPALDWSERWKQDLTAIAVSPRLMLRPSFDSTPPAAGQHVLTIDPGQAFGTGGHESTRLALECIDRVSAGLEPGFRVLDVGTGTGVLVLAALRFGAGFCLGLDLDPLAGEAARENARVNALDPSIFVGTTDALRGEARFDLVVANLLWSETRPLVSALAWHTRAAGRLVVSGLLESQCPQLEAAVAAHGLRVEHARACDDANGVSWTGLVMRR